MNGPPSRGHETCLGRFETLVVRSITGEWRTNFGRVCQSVRGTLRYRQGFFKIVVGSFFNPNSRRTFSSVPQKKKGARPNVQKTCHPPENADPLPRVKRSAGLCAG